MNEKQKKLSNITGRFISFDATPTIFLGSAAAFSPAYTTKSQNLNI